MNDLDAICAGFAGGALAGFAVAAAVFMMMKDVAEKPYKRANPEYEKNKARYPKGSHHANSDISLDMLHHTSRASRKQKVSDADRSIADLKRELSTYPKDSPRYNDLAAYIKRRES